MPGLRRRGSIVLVGGFLLIAGVACSSDTTTTTDTTAGTSSTTSTSVSTSGSVAPGTTAATDGTGTTPTTEPGAPVSSTTTGAKPDPSVPIVDPASTEAFCALDSQINDLSEAQLKDANPNDAESFRALLAKFLTDNAAVIDQYVAAAPPEIADDVEATIAQTRAAVDDPATFEQVISESSEVSDRVSAFIDANCKT